MPDELPSGATSGSTRGRARLPFLVPIHDGYMTAAARGDGGLRYRNFSALWTARQSTILKFCVIPSFSSS